MITKFKVTIPPLDANLKIDGVAVVKNQEYPISKQADMTLDVLGRAVPYDTFRFKVGNDDANWSAEMTATINVQVNNQTPVVTLLDIFIPTTISASGESYPYIINSQVSFNDSTDRYKIDLISPKDGYIAINGQNAKIGVTYRLCDLVTMAFVSTAAIDSKNALTTIYISPGNVNEWGASTPLNITTKGNLSSVINGTSNTDTIL